MRLDISSIPDWFARTSPGQAAIAEARATELEERRRLVAEIERLREEREEAHAELRPKLEKAREREAKATAVSREAREARRKLEREIFSLSTRGARGIRDLEAELRHSAPSAIAAFRDGLFELHEETRRADSGLIQMTPEDHNTGRPAAWGPSSHASIVRRLEAIREAIRETERLELQALSEEELEGRIEEIREAIPAIGGEGVAALNGGKPA